MTDEVRDKDAFMKRLKGEPVAEDAVGNVLYIGDIIAYSTTVAQSAVLKFGRIEKVVKKVRRGGTVPFAKIHVRGVVKDYNGHWEVSGIGCPHPSNAILMTEPPKMITELLDKFENEKGDKS